MSRACAMLSTNSKDCARDMVCSLPPLGWATLLPRALGLSRIGKQILIMDVSIRLFLFEGHFFCLRERERERESANHLRPGAAGRRVTQEFLIARATVLLKPLPYGLNTFLLALEVDLTLWHGYWKRAALRPLLRKSTRGSSSLFVPDLAWSCLKVPELA